MADVSKIQASNGTTYDIKDANVPHSSLSAQQGGTDLSLVTTGEKYTWNNASGGSTWEGTQAEYDALATHDPNVTYFITDGASSTIALADLDDVSITSPADNNVLVYNSTNQDWENTAFSYNNLTDKPTITDTKVTQTNTSTSATYRLLLSGTDDNTTRTEGAYKSAKFYANPSTGDLSISGGLFVGRISARSLTVSDNTSSIQFDGGLKTLTALRLWQGSLSSGSVSFADIRFFNYLIVFQNSGSDSNRKSIIIPTSMLSTTDMAFQFHTESYFISFKIKKDTSTNKFVMTYQNRSSGSSLVIRDVWGAN